MERRRRRVIVEIERRTLTLGSIPGSKLPRLQTTVDGGRDEPAEPCPTCGGPWVLLQGGNQPEQAGTPPELLGVLHSFNLHVQVRPSGEIWICLRSLDRIGESP